VPNVVVKIDQDGIALVELNRPKVLNALSLELMSEFRKALETLEADTHVKALLLTGRGKGFCAGADLSAVPSDSNSTTRSGLGSTIAELMQNHFNPMMRSLHTFPKPVICAVNGVAAGGGAALALCADLVIVSTAAVMKIVQVPRLGIVADLGANWLLPRLVGRGRAMGACLLGDDINASTLYKWGMVWEVTEPGCLIETAQEYGKRLGQSPPEAIVATRILIDNAFSMSYAEMLEAERNEQALLSNQNITFVDRARSFQKK
jgi:2-(1,2-epoxy-1,2-dihydrophenyl)acetyl-CoA isomerase